MQGFGFTGQERAISGVPTVQADGQRLTYTWDAAVQEWFINDSRGLEHGFTVRERPTDDPSQNSEPSTLYFLLTVRGGLRPAITSGGQCVEFRDASGATVLNYAGLKVWDADGKTLLAHFAAADAGMRLLVNERGARYPITIDPSRECAPRR